MSWRGAAVLVLLGLAPGALVGAARADVRDFDAFSFRVANQSDKLVILDFHTKVCPRCRGKSPMVEKILTDKRIQHVEVFLVNYDEDAKLRKKYDVLFRSTVLFIHRGQEIERVTGEIRHEELEAAIRAGLEHALGRMR